MQLFYFIHKGKRHHQEDFLTISKDQKLYTICDGVGGKPGGQFASQIVADAIDKYYQNTHSTFQFQNIAIPVKAAIDELSDLENIKQSLKGLSSTFLSVYIQDGQCYFAHVGDTKGYLISQNRIEYVTKIV